jgi:hypothetical protein
MNVLSHNPFILPEEDYKRDIDPLGHYKDDAARYLSIMSGRAKEYCATYIEKEMAPGGKFEFKDPSAMFLFRQENGDRVKRAMPFLGYLNEAIKNQELIAATFTTYIHPSKKQSLLVDYIDDNVAMRSKAKKAMFAAKASGDKATAVLKKIEQNSRKIRNNAISGSHVTPSTPMYNPTGHSTLTSTCRVTSGYGNVNNEKFVAGNRHYWSPQIALNNIVSIINHSDYTKIRQVMEKYDIAYPTVQDTMDCITYSSNLYWPHAVAAVARLRVLVEKLTPIERAAFVYTGDMYHLMKHNQVMVRTFLDKLSRRADTPHPEPEGVIDKVRGDYLNLAGSICADIIIAHDLGENQEPPYNNLKGTKLYGIIAATAENIANVLSDYSDLISAFWVTSNVPASLARLPDSIRRVALVSDTDSTIFTVQDWVIWHQGRPGFDPRCKAIGASMIFLASQTVTHLLAKMSANFGIEQKRLFQIAMKNEYYFDVFVPTQVAKHYYAVKSIQEGQIFAKLEEEIKGVHLKSSNVSKEVIKEAAVMMRDIMDLIMMEKKINLLTMVKRVADIERRVIATIKRGDEDYFKSTQIKNAESYTKEKEDSPFKHHLFWQEVFAPKYGFAEEPPYAVLKISVDLSSKVKVRNWIAGFKDRELAARMEKYIEKTGKMESITTFQLPQPVVSQSGIPEEIFEMINYRRIVMDTVKVLYLVLQTLGWFHSGENNLTRLVSDDY